MRKLPLAIFGLALLCASQAPAGTATRDGVKPVLQAHYSFCWDEAPGPKIVYFSAVMTWAPSLTLPAELNGPFSSYLTKTYGAHAGLPACRTWPSKDNVVALKKQQDAEYVWRKWKIVETNWAGAGVPGAASSLTTPPTASANAQTLPPPAAQAVTDTAKAQVNGQIKQAGKKLFDKLLPP
jgi:hypothetical protein